MSTEDQREQSKERLITGWEWIGCSLIAAALSTLGNAKNYADAGIAGMLGGFVGSLVVVVLFWVFVRGVFRWITKKRGAA